MVKQENPEVEELRDKKRKRRRPTKVFTIYKHSHHRKCYFSEVS